MKKKLISMVLLAVMVAALGTGCAPRHHLAAPPTPPGAPPPPAP